MCYVEIVSWFESGVRSNIPREAGGSSVGGLWLFSEQCNVVMLLLGDKIFYHDVGHFIS